MMILSLTFWAMAQLFGPAYAIGIPRPQFFDWKATKSLIAFGDSYSFVQGTRGVPGFSFINGFTDLPYTPQELLSDYIVQNFTGTAEGGPNYLEYLTGCAVKNGLYLPSRCSLQLWDFAVAGADVTGWLTPPHHNFTTPLVNQTQQYLKYADRTLFPLGRLDPNRERTLVSMWIGINDISDSAKYAVDFPSFYDEIIDAQFDAVQTLYDAGFNNFLFLDLPPLNRTPSALTAKVQSVNSTMIAWWGSSLTRHVSAFEKRNSGAKAMVYGANAFLNGVLDHAASYGLTNITTFCPSYANITFLTDAAALGCSPYPTYFWYNSGHMTSRVHQIMAPDIARFLEQQSTSKLPWV